MLLSILLNDTTQQCYSASGCASSDVSVRSESESLSLLLQSIEDSLLFLSAVNVNSQQLYVSRKTIKHPVLYQRFQQAYLSVLLFHQFKKPLSWRYNRYQQTNFFEENTSPRPVMSEVLPILNNVQLNSFVPER
jgi:hypothetical protein